MATLRAAGAAGTGAEAALVGRMAARRDEAERLAREAAEAGARAEARERCAEAKRLGVSGVVLHQIMALCSERARAIVAALQAAAASRPHDASAFAAARAAALAAGLTAYVREADAAVTARRDSLRRSLRSVRASLAGPSSRRGLLSSAAALGGAPPPPSEVDDVRGMLSEARALGLGQDADATEGAVQREAERVCVDARAAALAGDPDVFERAMERARAAGADPTALAAAEAAFRRRCTEAEAAVAAAGESGGVGEVAEAMRRGGGLVRGGPGSAIEASIETLARRRGQAGAAVARSAIDASEGVLSGRVGAATASKDVDEAGDAARGLALDACLALAHSILLLCEAVRKGRGAGLVARVAVRRLPGGSPGGVIGAGAKVAQDVVSERVAAMITHEVSKRLRWNPPSIADVAFPVLPSPSVSLSSLIPSLCLSHSVLPASPQARTAPSSDPSSAPWVASRCPAWPPACNAPALVAAHAVSLSARGSVPARGGAMERRGSGSGDVADAGRAGQEDRMGAGGLGGDRSRRDEGASRPESIMSEREARKDVPPRVLTKELLMER